MLSGLLGLEVEPRGSQWAEPRLLAQGSTPARQDGFLTFKCCDVQVKKLKAGAHLQSPLTSEPV